MILEFQIKLPESRSPNGRNMTRLLVAELAAGLTHPSGGGVDSLPEQEIYLGGMVLDVAHVVEEQFQSGQVGPDRTCALVGSFIGEPSNDFFAFLTTVFEVVQEFVFGVDTGRQFAGRIKFFKSERSRRNKPFLLPFQIEVEPEQRMGGHVPDFMEV